MADPFETQPAQPTGLDLSVEGWTLRDVPGGFSISAGLDTVALQVELIPSKPAAVHKENGILDFSPYGWSYYYSYTRVAVRGVLLERGLPRPVTGTAWIDHQWGDFISVTSGGWDWYSVQLADGRDFTASVVRDEFGVTLLRYGTLVGPRRRNEASARRRTGGSSHRSLDQPAHGRRLSVRLDDLSTRRGFALAPGTIATRPGA